MTAEHEPDEPDFGKDDAELADPSELELDDPDLLDDDDEYGEDDE